MNTFKKVIVGMLLSAFGYAHAEMATQEAEVVPVQAEQKAVEPEVVQAQSVADVPVAIVDDGQENQELEQYLQELSQEFEKSGKDAGERK